MDAILIDSGAFIALLIEKDDQHVRASGLYAELIGRRLPLVTTNHVVDETCTHLLYHYPSGHQLALKFGRFIRESTCLLFSQSIDLQAVRGPSVLYTTPDIERAAWDIFARYDTAGFSFTDCVSFAAMQSLGIRKAFTFDKHYDTMGFERL